MTKPMNHPETSLKGSLIRPTFAPGLLLEDDDLTAGVSYTRGLTQLLFRSLFGCGVICGYKLSPKLICNGRKLQVEVSAGVGLDCLGNPLELRRATVLEFDPECADWPASLWVTACYTEIPCRPRELACGEDVDAQRSFTRLVGGVRIELHAKRPDCACSCEPPEPAKGGKGKGCCDDDEGAEEAALAAAPAAAKSKPTSVKDPKPATQETTKGDVVLSPVNGPVTGAGTEKMEFDCYADHMAGECGCGCDCACILIGKIDLGSDTEDGTIPASYASVRQIRPWLIGQELDRARRS
jgi:hypothetical protein